jgi:radical SAM protein with 4Fe4S-binding SPASM domain
LRYDGNPKRNREIKAQRLTEEEIVAVEMSNPERLEAIKESCHRLRVSDFSSWARGQLFRCGAGKNSFSVNFDGTFRLCASLWHPDYLYDLRRGSLHEAWYQFVPAVRAQCSGKSRYLENCHTCPHINLCRWCPAYCYLETGELDEPVPYFCRVTQRRVAEASGAGDAEARENKESILAYDKTDENQELMAERGAV